MLKMPLLLVRLLIVTKPVISTEDPPVRDSVEPNDNVPRLSPCLRTTLPLATVRLS